MSREKEVNNETTETQAGPGTAQYREKYNIPKVEVRDFVLSEVRFEEDDGQRKMLGYAAVFDDLSGDLWGFKERIQRGAFAKTIQEADIRALWNHDSNFVLGRRKSGTLKLWEDEHGLGVEILPPDTVWANDLMTTMERGDVDQMSFAFSVVREEWGDPDDGMPVRELQEVKLFDVSPVTYPAYEGTDVSVRGAFGIGATEFFDALHRVEAGAKVEKDLRMISDVFSKVTSRLDAAPSEGGHPASEPERSQPVAAPSEVGHPAENEGNEGHVARHANRKRRLELARKVK